MINSLNTSFSEIKKAVGFFLIGYCLFSTLFSMVDHQYASLYTPLIGSTLDMIYPEGFSFSEIKLENKGLNLSLKVALLGDVISNGKSRKAELSATPSINMRMILISQILILSLIVSWPGVTFIQRLSSAFFALQLNYLITLIDVSYTIMISTEMQVNFNLVSQKTRVFIIHFLNNGGRQVLGVFVTWISIKFSVWGISGKPAQPSNRHPAD